MSKVEWEGKRLLEDRGYIVNRGAGSHGTDLITLEKGGAVRFIEVKSMKRGKHTYSFKHSKSEWEQYLHLRKMRDVYGADVDVMIRCRGGKYDGWYLSGLQGHKYDVRRMEPLEGARKHS